MNKALILITCCTLGSGIMAGLFFVFSNFTMKALSKLEPAAGISAMQNINKEIINPSFMLLFFGTAAGSAGIIALAAINWGQPGSAWAFSGGSLYLIGCILITMRFNVPLNDTLSIVNPHEAGSAIAWNGYIKKWLLWNHIRMAATTLSCLAYLQAITKIT